MAWQLIIFFKQLEMTLCLPQKITTFFERPVRRAVFVIVFAYRIQRLPMLQDFTISLPDSEVGVINMVGFGSTTVEFKNGIVFSFLEIVKLNTFDVITSVIELIG